MVENKARLEKKTKKKSKKCKNMSQDLGIEILLGDEDTGALDAVVDETEPKLEKLWT